MKHAIKAMMLAGMIDHFEEKNGTVLIIRNGRKADAKGHKRKLTIEIPEKDVDSEPYRTINAVAESFDILPDRLKSAKEILYLITNQR